MVSEKAAKEGEMMRVGRAAQHSQEMHQNGISPLSGEAGSIKTSISSSCLLQFVQIIAVLTLKIKNEFYRLRKLNLGMRSG